MTEPPFTASLPGRLVVADLAEIRDRYFASRLVVSQRARWDASDPGAPPDTCRYCGKHWRKWAGSKLDGHAKCVVDEDFKARLRELLRDPMLTFGAVAAALDVTPSVVRSWTFPIRDWRRTR